jgi:hypothetical protein
MSLMPMKQGAYGQPVNDQGILMQDISRQRKLAEELRRQGSEQLQGQMVSGHYVAPSWTQGLAKVLQTSLGAYQEGKADEAEKDYSSQKNKRFAEILNGNKERQIEGAPQISTTMPAYTPEQQDQFGSPLPGVQREAIQTSTPTFTQESPEQVQQRQQAAILQYMQQYGNTPEAQVMLAQLNKQDDRAYARTEKLDDRKYQGTVRQEDRDFQNANREDQQEFQRIQQKEQFGQQLTMQEKQFAQQFQLQNQSQNFTAGQNALNRNFQAGQNQLSRDNTLQVAQSKLSPKNKGLSVTAQKELIDAEDAIQGSKEALKDFSKALKLNDKAMGGFGAGALATAGTVLPDFLRPQAVDDTKELDNVLQNSALPQLKAIFGGMPTEGERAILLEVQGSSAQPAAVRKGIFERAQKAAEKRIKYNQEKAKQLRNGTYFTEEGGINIEEQAPASNGGWSIKPL